MPTIDELAPAPAAADTDLLMVSQGGIARRLTRAQLLDGLQPTLALPAGTLLGCEGLGGAPGPIAVGPHLSLAAGVLDAAAPYSVAALPAGRPPAVMDTIPLAQNGADAAVTYGVFMGGLSQLAGIDASRLLATPTGAGVARTLGDLFADSIAIEDFGAVADGLTDNAAALSAAIAGGKPVRFGPGVYVIDGPFAIPTPAVLLGVPGQTVLRRMAQQSPVPWITVSAPSFAAHGIRFDGNAALIQQDGGGVVVAPACRAATFHACGFGGVAGATAGSGLLLAADGSGTARYAVEGCEAFSNALHGIALAGLAAVTVSGCRSYDNAGDGIHLDQGGTAPAAGSIVRLSGNACWNNRCGISVGNWSAAPVSSSGPAALLIAGNLCYGNTAFGIAAAAGLTAISGNLLTGNGGAGAGGGIRAPLSLSRVAGNVIAGGAVGIDISGATGCDVVQNTVSGAAIGIAANGTARLSIAGNTLDQNGWAVSIANAATDATGGLLATATSGVSITENRIGFAAATGGGILLTDGPLGILVGRNTFFGTGSAVIGQALAANTDSLIVEGNRWNNTARLVCNPAPVGTLQTLTIPDIADGAMITSAPSGVQSILTAHQFATLGQITFIRVTSGGSGYTEASVAISGSGSGGSGSGAAARAIIAGGAVVAIEVTNPGSGYGGPGASATVSISGDGSGAAAIASVGIPVIEGRRLHLACNTAVLFNRADSAPLQENWTLFDITVAANGMVEFVGTNGAWRAVAFPSADYLSPGGDGSAVLRTAGTGDLTLRPAGTGQLHIGTDAEPVGYVSCVGRGSPAGQVSAPPGSDYRNLNGGAGSTLWIKQSGTDASGWLAIA